MQNPVPDAPSERPDRQDADIPTAPRETAPRGTAPDSIFTAADSAIATARVVEIDGPSGPEPTRYGDWERKGRCIDF